MNLYIVQITSKIFIILLTFINVYNYTLNAKQYINERNQVIESIIAKIDNTIILNSELKDFINNITINKKIVSSNFTKKQALNLLIKNILIKNECKKSGLTISKIELTRVITKIKKNMNLTTKQFKSMLDLHNNSISNFIINVKLHLLQFKLIHKKLKYKININEEDILNKYFSIYKYKQKIHKINMYNIFLQTYNNQFNGKITQNKQSIFNIKKHIINKNTFLTTAKQLKNNKNIIFKYIKQIQFGELSRKISNFILHNKTYQILEPIKSLYGWNLILITHNKQITIPQFSKIKEAIKIQLIEEKGTKLLNQYINTLKNNAFITNLL
jgi:hypothetical protein